jgi:hypothetical protein
MTDDAGSVELSVIVPAYNEATRLPLMLDECLEFLGRTQPQLDIDIPVITTPWTNPIPTEKGFKLLRLA